MNHLIAHACSAGSCPIVRLATEPVIVAPESHPITPRECPLLGEVLETNERGVTITQPGGETLQSCEWQNMSSS